MGLSGLGILNYNENRSLPEERFLRGLLRGRQGATVLDIGAHRGSYASEVIAVLPQATVYAFEPHPNTFPHLKSAAQQHGFQAINSACGARSGYTTLYDHTLYDRHAEENGTTAGSEHASIHEEVFAATDGRGTLSWNVPVCTVDDFLQQAQIARVDLLKIDTEGNELPVLHGAGAAISGNKIDVIQFEFNDMNIASRVFFKDFYHALPGYRFYRMLPDGLIALGDYAPLLCELFSCQNIVAIRDGALKADTVKNLGL